ncbi:MAG TPA: hypothetical protein VKU41_12550 [Polyangiaceae bacterium]|nr:hypothetical protein [Polyangiaceae bacterium]
MAKIWIAHVMSLGLLACSGATPASSAEGFGAASADSGGVASHGGASGATRSTGNGASSGMPGASTGGDGVSGSVAGPAAGGDAGAGSLFDSGPPPDASGTYVVTLKMDPFTVQPGQEVFKCQQFGNPFGKDVDLVYYDGTMSAGSHHFFVFNMDATTGRTQAAPLGDCPGGGLEFHPFPYLSQQPRWIVSYPEPGMGYPMSANNGLMLNAHYLNSGSSPLTANVTIAITVVPRASVKTHVGSIFLNNTFFSVPAGVPMSTPVAESAWNVPLLSDYDIFTSWSHMHRWGLKFTASANGSTFYSETNWDSPQLFVHEPYLAMKGGTNITWSCDYYNDTGSTLTFGESAVNSVMCIYIGQYFPADPNNPDIVQVLQ